MVKHTQTNLGFKELKPRFVGRRHGFRGFDGFNGFSGFIGFSFRFGFVLNHSSTKG